MASTSVGSASSYYCLRWNNHLSNMLDAFEHLFKTEGLTDVTLWLNRKQSIKCHRIVLAACSAVFEHLFLENPNKPHFYVMLPGVKYTELKLILEYIYRGETNVAQEQLKSLLKLANILQVILGSSVFYYKNVIIHYLIITILYTIETFHVDINMRIRSRICFPR